MNTHVDHQDEVKCITSDALFVDVTSALPSMTGRITFDMAGVSVVVTSMDVVGGVIQNWLEQYMIDHAIFFKKQHNTQESPDFYLSESTEKNLIEVKSFNYLKTPGFDIANFDAYCSSIIQHPYRLDADYLIFGYQMDKDGLLSIKRVWLKKVWEIAGKTGEGYLKTQNKRGRIYNIRPGSNFKNGTPSSFSGKEEFLNAIYKKIVNDKNYGLLVANEWADKLENSYNDNYGKYPLGLRTI